MLLENVQEAMLIESAEDAAIADNMSDDDISTLEALMIEEGLIEEACSELQMECSKTPKVSYVEEASIVKLDKQAKRNRDYKFAILKCARNGKDSRVKQLMTLWKMEAFLMRKLEEKWGTKAKGMMRKTAAESKKNKVPGLSALVQKRSDHHSSGGGVKPSLRKGATKPNNYKPPAILKRETNTIAKKLANKVK